jgi:hypothetical protein
VLCSHASTIASVSINLATSAGTRFGILFRLKLGLKPRRFATRAGFGPGANAGGRPARLRIHIASNDDMAMKLSDFTPSPQPFELDLDDLLHPAQAFAHPRDVVHDPDLIVNEKRAILACLGRLCRRSGADAAMHPGAGRAVSVDEILEALRALDKEANDAGRAGRTRREVRRRSLETFRVRRARTQPGSGNDLSR